MDFDIWRFMSVLVVLYTDYLFVFGWAMIWHQPETNQQQTQISLPTQPCTMKTPLLVG